MPKVTFSNIINYLFNALIGLSILITFSPVFLWVYIKLKLSGKKNTIFKQVRVGKNEKLFTIYKFKTMKENATKDGPFICTSYEDSRITEFGKFLRRKKLDELPQAINLIKGDMAFVGPRPEIPHFHKKNIVEIQNWIKRIKVKPGITGLAQLSRTVSHDPSQKIIEDIKYINNKSFLYDMKLILRTLYLWITNKTL